MFQTKKEIDVIMKTQTEGIPERKIIIMQRLTTETSFSNKI